MRPTQCLKRYVTAWGPYSRGQKHMMFQPTPFVYRMPKNAGRNGVTPYTSKHWWTLGTWPSGREVPFRLQEFLANYQQLHVPADMEEWLDASSLALADAVIQQIEANLEQFVQGLESADSDGSDAAAAGAHEHRVQTWKRPAPLPSRRLVLEPLQRAFDAYCTTIPAAAVRGVTSDPSLRVAVADAAAELCCVLREQNGQSTPHKRWAAQAAALPRDVGDEDRSFLPFPSDETLVGALPVAQQRSSDVEEVSTGSSAQALVSTSQTLGEDDLLPPQSGAPASEEYQTGPDDKLLVRLLTLFADGANRSGHPEQAEQLLGSAFMFANEEDSAALHAGLASTKNRMGQYREAQHHAQESVLLSKSPLGYANWAIAVALQDNVDGALRVACEGLAVHPDSPVLNQCYDSLVKQLGTSTTTPTAMRNRRFHGVSTPNVRLPSAPGTCYKTAWSTPKYKGRALAWRINPRSGDQGTDFHISRIPTLMHNNTNAREAGF